MSSKRVVIYTPSLGLGELIRQALADIGDYDGVLTFTEAECLGAVQNQPAALAILDSQVGTEYVAPLIAQLRQLSPDLLAILISRDKYAARLEGLEVDRVLPAPFYLPDLIEAIETLFGPSVKAQPPVEAASAPVSARTPPFIGSEAPGWLGDLSEAARHLARLSIATSSQATLITRGGKVWASAGELSKAATEELALAISEYVGRGGDTDVARFVHLEATGADYMLYATRLAADYALAMVFDAETPFSTIRRQAGELANALALAPQVAMAEAQQVEGMAHVADVFAELEHEDTFSPMDFARESGPAGFERGPSRREVSSAEQETPRSQPVSPPDSDDDRLLFTYVLIPRLPNHRLKGDLAAKLANWLPLLCVAYGWRLEHMTVQKQFLQWTVALSADTAPRRVALVAQEYLSEHIFEDFPRIRRQNPSGEFWAPGALILSGANPAPEQIASFIRSTRKKQGIPTTL